MTPDPPGLVPLSDWHHTHDTFRRQFLSNGEGTCWGVGEERFAPLPLHIWVGWGGVGGM